MVLNKLLKAFGLISDANQQLIDELHAQIVRAARQPEFYLSYGVRDDFDKRFEVFCLLCSLVLQKLHTSPHPAQDVAQDLIDAVVRHLEIILRQEGIGDVAVPKRIKKYIKSFYGRHRAYAAACALADKQALLESLYRNLSAGIEGDKKNLFAADRMLHYVQRTISDFEGLELVVFTDGLVPFPDPALVH
jgi:cytochrome b pre-mRNA-processing protein 3